MRSRWLSAGVLVLAVGLYGCGKKEVDPEPTDETRVGDSIDINLAEWLGLPRARLAELARETHDRLLSRLKDSRTDADSVGLLRKLRMPLTTAVLRQAEFSKKRGVSLPPYVKEDEHDSVLALHLARHGDVEAAHKLVDPADQGTARQIDACRTTRNYPVEWTRLVSLTLQEAQLKMALGELEGATELVLLQRQLRTLLDAKTASGPLGAALLPLGRRALRDAVVEWRESTDKKPHVAEEVETTLKDWGEPPAPQPALLPGASRAAVAETIKEINQGRMLAARSPQQLLRALDLLNLPLVGERLEAVVAWFDDKDQLAEFWYLYGASVGELFPEPLHLAHHLAEHGLAGKPAERAGGLSRQSFAGGKLVFDVLRLERSSALGAVLRVANAQEAPSGAPPSHLGGSRADPRDFGPVHLGWTFEQTRVELAPEEAPGKVLTLTKADLLAQLKHPVTSPHPTQAVVEKAADNLIGGLVLHWPADEKLNLVALDKLLLPLWGAYGPCRFDSANNSLILVWDQAPLRLSLTLPYNDAEPPVFTVRDQRGDKDAAQRLKEAVALDLQRRKARWEDKKPLVRLPRYLQWPDLVLGLTREEALKAVPRDLKTRPVLKTADGSVSVLFTSKAPKTAPYFPLQMFLRFDAADRLAEVRIRYQEGPAAPTAANPALLDVLKKAGAPEAPPAPWLGLWADYPPARPPVYHRWTDDRTFLTYQRDSGCIEVVLHDCPLEHVRGVPLPPLEFCPRGPEGCQLGDSREELLRRWKISTPTTTPDGGLVLPQSERSPYDLAVVYFEGNLTVRILGQLRAVPSSKTGDFTADLQKAWLTDLDHLGVVRRIDWMTNVETDNPVNVGYTWHDDRVRVHTQAQLRKDGHRLFTEWREWPVSVPRTTVAKP